MTIAKKTIATAVKTDLDKWMSGYSPQRGRLGHPRREISPRRNELVALFCLRAQQPIEIFDGFRQALPQLHSGAHVEQLFGQADIGATLPWIILGQWPVNDL